ncbi:hypothetical protein, partial [Acinetobacter ursingii]|uniref:hypothetical protein n=1 Tax=Acinetobacter ursingii TaxID=108980 RepID=UPI001C073834
DFIILLKSKKNIDLKRAISQLDLKLNPLVLGIKKQDKTRYHKPFCIIIFWRPLSGATDH